jgi:hypothetical protein
MTNDAEAAAANREYQGNLNDVCNLGRICAGRATTWHDESIQLGR